MNNQTINEINNRDLDSCFFSIYFVPCSIYSNKGNDYIKQQTIYSVVACNIHGIRRYITSIFADDYQKTSDWYSLFSLWKKRGISTIFFAVIPENKQLENALVLAFPEIKCFLSCFNTINKVISYFSVNYSCSFFNKIKNIIIAKDINEFNLKKQEFLEESENFPFIYDLIENDLKIAAEYMQIPYDLRKHIYSFYFIRDYIRKLSCISHSKPYFTSISEFEELLLSTIKTFEFRMYCGKNEWNKIINIIYSDKKDLLIRYL